MKAGYVIKNDIPMKSSLGITVSNYHLLNMVKNISWELKESIDRMKKDENCIGCWKLKTIK